MWVVLASGTLAGLALFAIQHFTVTPLIERAEEFETAAHASGAPHAGEEWRPGNERQRTFFTALATILSGIGFAALLFGVVAIARRTVDARTGALWGMAGLTCFH